MTIHIGCQTYTWQMSHEKYAGKIPHILDVVQKAGFAGFEPEVGMLGNYFDHPSLLHDELDQRGLKLGALCLNQAWAQPELTDGERDGALRAIEYARRFPGAVLMLGHEAGANRSDLKQRQQSALANMNEVGRMASERGIRCAFHPNSPDGSIFRTEQDYEVLMNGMDRAHCGYAPDTGHITNGGMDALLVMTAYRELIRHAHFKDITAEGKWTVMGQGIIPHTEIVQMLRDTGYDGWIMVEEESTRAESEPDEVTLENGRYVQENLMK